MATTTAEEDLRSAVMRMLTEEGAEEGFITELAVVVAVQSFDEDGDPQTRMSSIWPDNPPMYRRIGLLDFELSRLRSLFAAVLVEDDDDD